MKFLFSAVALFHTGAYALPLLTYQELYYLPKDVRIKYIREVRESVAILERGMEKRLNNSKVGANSLFELFPAAHAACSQPAIPSGSLATTNNLNVSGWVFPESHWLVQLALSDPIYLFSRSIVSLGANENSVFQTKFPGLEMLSMGPQILNAHSFNERMQVHSFLTLESELRALLVKLGTAKPARL